MLCLTLIAIIASILIIYYINSLNYWKKRNVAFIKTFPILGGMKDVILKKKNLSEVILEYYKKCPEKRYYGSFLFTKPCLTIKDIDLIKKITVKDFDYFVDHIRSINTDAEPLFAKNLAALRGQKWREMRNTLSPLFTGSKIRIMFNLISDSAKQLNEYFSDQFENDEIVEFEAKEVMSRIATDIIATTSFGIECNSLKEDTEFYKMGKLLVQSNLTAYFKAMMQSISPKLSRKLGISQVPKEISNFFSGVIKETLKEREEKGIIRQDMIHIMMEAKGKKRPEENLNIPETGFAVVKDDDHQKNDSNENESTPINVEDIIAQGFVFFLAGFEIVSTMMAFLCHELALNQDIQKKLQQEIDVAFNKTNEKLNYEEMVHMKYLDMVISEILRKWPLGIMLSRECVRDYKLIGSEIHGENDIVIEKGVSIMIPVYGIHRDPNFYPNPDHFDPERFNDTNKHNINPYAYLPFGIGPRSCIGSRLALLEVKVLIVYLLRRFELVVIERTEKPLRISPKKPGLSPDSFWLGLKQRIHF
ncbi:cytochrome P450 9e2-like [Onthophagus taurus]|uniref:cytochrome P450 9e2-like n=1 Tax=Onthophagus taurus TaxID=166361 RepID=UPI0039BE56DD